MSQNDNPDERAKQLCNTFNDDDRAWNSEDASDRAAWRRVAARMQRTYCVHYNLPVMDGIGCSDCQSDDRTPETAEPPALTDEQIDAVGAGTEWNLYDIASKSALRRFARAILALASTPPPEQASTPKIKAGDLSLPYELQANTPDQELPGMWSRTDFEGGEPDTRSYAERARQASTPRAEPAAYMYSHDESTRTTFRMPDERMNERRWHETPLYTLPPNTAPDEAAAVAALRALVENEGLEAYKYLDKGFGTATAAGKRWLAARRVLGGNPAAVSVEGLGVDAQGFDVHPAEPSGSSHGPDGAGDGRGRVANIETDLKELK